MGVDEADLQNNLTENGFGHVPNNAVIPGKPSFINRIEK
jgi:hypothetical protein